MPDVAASWTWPNRGVETAWISLEASVFKSCASSAKAFL